MFEVIAERSRQNNQNIKECLIWASRFDKDVFFKIKRYEREHGMIHPLNKRFYMNDRRLNQLKYAQVKFVLKSEGFRLSDSQIKAKKDAWRNEIERLLKD